MKKIISLMLVLLLSLGVTTIAMAAEDHKAKITGMARDLSYGYSGDTDLGVIAPQDNSVIYIDLTDHMFTWDGNYVPAATPGSLSSSQIRDAKLEVKASNSRLLNSVTLNKSKSRIEIDFIDELTGVNEKEFDFDVILSINNKQQRDYAMNFTGTMENPVYEAYADTEYMDISGGEVIEAAESVKAIELDLGGGISVNTKLMKGRRAQAVAKRVSPPASDSFANTHKTVKEMIALETAGLNRSECTVKLGGGLESYRVYSKDGIYLGTGSDKLPLESIYYLSATKLEIPGALATEDVPTSSPGPVIPDSAPKTEPDDAAPASEWVTDDMYPPNVNENPYTGR